MPSHQFNLTDQQTAAVAAGSRSTALAAGAGCGKTFVLTERFLSFLDPRKIDAGVRLHELVAITFTDAAAREMRDRIRRRCFEQLRAETDPEMAAAWQNLLRAIDSARISTIHSFCQSLLRTHAVEAGLDPRFEVLEPAAAEVLRLQTVDEVLRQLLTDGSEQAMQLARRFGLTRLREHLLRLLDKRNSPAMARWLGATPEELLAAWKGQFEGETLPEARQAFLENEALQALHRLTHEADIQRNEFAIHLARLHEVLDELQSSEDPRPLLRELDSLARVKGVCKKSDWPSEEQYEQYRDHCKAVRELVKKSPLRKTLDGESAREAAETGLSLLQVAAEVGEAYQRLLSERQALEMDDLLSRARRLLVPDEADPDQGQAIRDQLAGSTRLLMVDEFQDTDPLQVAIIQAFCGDDWVEQGLMVVGDDKQSIYRFRGAQPQVSHRLQKSLPAESRLSLTTNFRSQPAILDFVNALFFDAFGTPEAPYEPLRPSRPQVAPTPAVEFLWAPEVEKDETNPHDGSRVQQSRRLEARYIARRLMQLLDSGEPRVMTTGADGQPTARAIELGDIAILLRSLSDVPIYEEALRQHGLDYYLAGGHAFYAQQEIYDILNLLRAVASSADEVSLAGVLRSPLFALEDETLYWLVQTGGSLNAGLMGERIPQRLSTDQRDNVRRAAATLHWLRAGKDRWLVAELLQNALDRTGYDAAVLCEFMGQRKLANLQKILQQARTVDRSSPGDLSTFITQLSQFVSRAPKEPLASTQAEGDTIRIMTIHHAKGLEFPVVVLPDLNRGLNLGVPEAVLDEGLGPLVRRSERLRKNEPDTIVGHEMIRHREEAEELAERQRLLYVACTRAADYLLLSSNLPDPTAKRKLSDWLEMLGSRFDLRKGTLQGELPPGYPVPEILVTMEEPAIDRKGAGDGRGVDLTTLAGEVRCLAAEGQGRVPAEVAPVPVHAAARRRFSFSRLSGKLVRTTPDGSSSEGEADTERGTFTTLDPREFGTLVHAALERVNFHSPGDVHELCEFLAPQHLEQEADRAAEEAAPLVEAFLRSPRAEQIASAPVVRKEVEFVVACPPGAGQSPAGRYLHGFIDCLYQDAAGGWHLVDYKSNQVTAEGVARLAEHYRMQMYVYALACRQAQGVWPVECVLHFLRPGVDFAFTWDEATGNELAAQIDEAIEAITTDE